VLPSPVSLVVCTLIESIGVFTPRGDAIFLLYFWKNFFCKYFLNFSGRHVGKQSPTSRIQAN
jgi:hypothetical protein